MRVILKSLFLIIFGVQVLFAGEYADAFLLASHHPQVQSLGYSAVATRVGSGHALNNPAGFATGARAQQLSLVYQEFQGLSNNLGFEGKYSLGEAYVLGVTVIHSSVDDLFSRPNLSGLTPADRRDSVLTLDNSSASIIDYREDGAFISIARQFEFEINLGWKFFKIPCRLPLGVSAKYIDKVLVDNRGLGFGIDIGSQLFFNLADMSRILTRTEFGFGLFLSDILNTPVYWTTKHQDAIKRSLTGGFSITQNFPEYASQLTITSSIQTRDVDVRQYGIGIKVKDTIFLRGGYDGYTPSLGLGIGLKKFIIDYSFSQHELANMQKIGINYHF
ncbi:MAG: hypothetical protein H8E26_09940 [FCB group bacterium]|nr:hypothetical protein [FCB group bacterium]MBL7028151.1 hypothetical protein [Candidatus Neomarinimicrobiota bacterium]MBL7122909.1 hypothetical protein [Candidatus Neomarinimicrobiota bacterium]